MSERREIATRKEELDTFLAAAGPGLEILS
jgi:hypothetical protein